jgi:hypothetical protein
MNSAFVQVPFYAIVDVKKLFWPLFIGDEKAFDVGFNMSLL